MRYIDFIPRLVKARLRWGNHRRWAQTGYKAGAALYRLRTGEWYYDLRANEEIRMTRKEDALNAEEFLLQFLQERRGQPVAIDEILERANTPEGRRAIASFDIRSAIWSLVGKGKVEFATGRKLTIKDTQ